MSPSTRRARIDRIRTRLLVLPVSEQLEPLLSEVIYYRNPLFQRLLFQLYIDIFCLPSTSERGKLVKDVCISFLLEKEVLKILSDSRLLETVDMTATEVVETCEELFSVVYAEFAPLFRHEFTTAPVVEFVRWAPNGLYLHLSE